MLLGKENVLRKERVETRQIVQDHPLFEVLREVRKEITQGEGYLHSLFSLTKR